jgi:uncharacterized protein YndB with AHSA1/START domain
MHGMHGTLVTVDDRPALHFERLLGQPVEAAWHAVTDPAELAHWFPAAVTIEPTVGGRLSFSLPGDEAPPSEGAISDLDPPHLVAFSWGAAHLRFELEPIVGQGCMLRFTHVLAEREQAARDAAGWHLCLDRLAAHLAGAPLDISAAGPTDEWRELYEDYRERGLPSGAAVPGDAGRG